MAYRLEDFIPDNALGWFAAQPINLSANGGRTPEQVAVMVLHRIAHLIVGLETSPTFQGAIGAKWVLAQLDRMPLREQPIVKRYIDRLAADLHQFEQRSGVVDPTPFAKLVEFSNLTPTDILASSSLYELGHPSGPRGDLSRWISYSMWKQSTGWG